MALTYGGGGVAEQDDWLGGLELPDEAEAERRARRLVNAIARLDGSREEKLRWLLVNLTLIEAEAQRAGEQPGTRSFGAAVVSIAFRFYRRHLAMQPVAPGQRPSDGWELTPEQKALKAARDRQLRLIK